MILSTSESNEQEPQAVQEMHVMQSKIFQTQVCTECCSRCCPSCNVFIVSVYLKNYYVISHYYLLHLKTKQCSLNALLRAFVLPL